ncbi:MAG: glycosyltransferase family 4 protein, partial [Candidatus Hydrogenedentes bacterium]|nr:glycosyltransferase family 4 protein [Candidatus Hydrogenedentota bacterium]
DVAVAAFAQVVKEFPEARLMLAGDGLVRPALEAQAAALGIAASVDFKGWVPPEQVPALIDRSSIVLMPSRYEEPFGLVAVQAGQMARPLVASRAGGIPEIVKDGETGLLVPPEDVSALAEAILGLLCDPEQAARLGRAARKHVEAAFELERVATAYETLYRHVCSN